MEKKIIIWVAIALIVIVGVLMIISKSNVDNGTKERNNAESDEITSEATAEIDGSLVGENEEIDLGEMLEA